MNAGARLLCTSDGVCVIVYVKFLSVGSGTVIVLGWNFVSARTNKRHHHQSTVSSRTRASHGHTLPICLSGSVSSSYIWPLEPQSFHCQLCAVWGSASQSPLNIHTVTMYKSANILSGADCSVPSFCSVRTFSTVCACIFNHHLSSLFPIPLFLFL